MGGHVPEKNERRLAFVIVDAQNKFFVHSSADAEGNRTAHVKVIAEVARQFRAAGRQVIFIKYDGIPHDCDGNTPDGERIIDGIPSDSSDIIVHKYHMNSSFKNTVLADAVQAMGCDSVLLAGLYTEYCVMATYWGACDHTFTPFLLEGGTIAFEEKQNRTAGEMCKTFSLAEVAANLAAPAARPVLSADPWAGCAVSSK